MEVIYNIATLCIKFSILYLYYRVFFVSRRFIYILWSVAAVIFIYSSIQGIGSLIQCLPLNSMWNPHVHRKCLVVSAADTVFGIANVTTDFIILILPMPPLWGLQTPLAQKFKLMGMFLLGGFVCFASIYRALVVHNLTKNDPSWTDSECLIWTAIELGTGIMSVSLPTYRPIFTKLVPKIKSKVASFGSGWDSDRPLELPVDMRTNSNPTSNNSEPDFQRSDSDPTLDIRPKRSRPSQSQKFAHIGILGGDLDLERGGVDVVGKDEPAIVTEKTLEKGS
ncbi:hypothetical protein OEA41_000653 [Lepraria neglecta]|uniref:Rhodopsin domain-containing protein n=1 Tax=Lepraria neglecta TaxID=209136 RepID=A0AAD9ZIV4_9LECA|nr:hypothetical protein OEA41_000653 [Lepraria neglecta]